MSSDTRRRSAGERKIDPPILLLSRTKKSNSTSKILDFFKATPPSLENALEDFEQAARLAMKVAELQRKGAEKLQRWAQNEGNTAIADVAEKMKQLMLMHCEQQLILAQEASDSMQDLGRMKPQSSELEQIEKIRDHLDIEDKKIEKQLKKHQLHGFPGSSSDVRSMLSERIRLSAKKDDADNAIHSLRNEAEVTKMFIFRKSVKSYADAFVNYATNASVIFSATRELAELVPAVVTEDVHHLRYEGGEVSRRKVNQVRRSLEHRTVVFEEEPLPSKLVSVPQMRVPVTPLKMGSSYKTVEKRVSPPPPYSPGVRYCKY